MTHLILQVLGNSDILVDDKEGFHQLSNVYSLEDIQQKAAWNNEDLVYDLDRVDFPLIKKLSYNQPSDTVFAFILTNQVRWMQEQNSSGEGWKNFVALDGIWWQKILVAWCEQQNLKQYTIVLDVAPEIRYGVADWEGMADAVDSILAPYFNIVENNLIYFQPNESEKIQVEKIIVQHSSGTPALSGALYLWGVENKLAVGEKIEFAYISEQELNCTTHSGKHWQWRLKDPQIRELLKIQDFSGALRLLDSQHQNYQQLKNNLEFLDKSVSLNLVGSSLQGRDSVIERISIAIWSEKAFRDRHQWMHWCLRIAGALELALLLLVETQGNGNYQWHQHKLIFNNDKNNGEIAMRGISKIVNELLVKGNLDGYFTANPVVDNDWQDFKKFYIANWRLEKTLEQTLGFITLRNRLYHSLIGDSIDQLLDQKTQELNHVTHREHPSQIAVNWLNYVIGLAGISAEVDTRAKVYINLVSEIINQL